MNSLPRHAIIAIRPDVFHMHSLNNMLDMFMGLLKDRRGSLKGLLRRFIFACRQNHFWLPLITVQVLQTSKIYEISSTGVIHYPDFKLNAAAQKVAGFCLYFMIIQKGYSLFRLVF